MPMPELPEDLSHLSLADIAQAVADKRLPPVEQWNPPHCGHSEMRIVRDGTWFHQNAPIVRPNMVRLFASILRREADGGYVLVTPAEKLDIDVEDAPFIAVELKSDGEGSGRTLAFRLNVGDMIMAGPDHPIRFVDRPDGPHPYLMVRGGMEALIARAVYYELAHLALDEGADPPGLWSNGAFFPMAPAP
jgi:uncharacterized protein